MTSKKIFLEESSHRGLQYLLTLLPLSLFTGIILLRIKHKAIDTPEFILHHFDSNFLSTYLSEPLYSYSILFLYIGLMAVILTAIFFRISTNVSVGTLLVAASLILCTLSLGLVDAASDQKNQFLTMVHGKKYDQVFKSLEEKHLSDHPAGIYVLAQVASLEGNSSRQQIPEDWLRLINTPHPNFTPKKEALYLIERSLYGEPKSPELVAIESNVRLNKLLYLMLAIGFITINIMCFINFPVLLLVMFAKDKLESAPSS